MTQYRIPSNRRYFLIDYRDLNEIDFSKVLETFSSTLSYRADGLYFLIKTEDDSYTPSTTHPYSGSYTYNEITTIQNNQTDWPQQDYADDDFLT